MLPESREVHASSPLVILYPDLIAGERGIYIPSKVLVV